VFPLSRVPRKILRTTQAMKLHQDPIPAMPEELQAILNDEKGAVA